MDRKTQYLDKKAELLDKPLFSLTVAEFLEVMESQIEEINEATRQHKLTPNRPDATEKYVYGLRGLAKLFGCSIKTAWAIKDSGRINGAIKQVGRTIVTNADLAITLAGEKQNPRKNAAVR